MKLYNKLIITSLTALSINAFAAQYNWNFQSSDQPGDDAFQYQQQWAKD